MKYLEKITLVLMFAFSGMGISAQTKTPVHVFDLEQTITQQLAQTFSGSLVRSAWKVNTNNVLSYEIRLVKGDLEYALLYDSEGKFLRKELVSPVIIEIKPVIHRKQPKSFMLQQLDSLLAPDSLILRY
jgi:hypothetical protein